MFFQNGFTEALQSSNATLTAINNTSNEMLEEPVIICFN